MGNLIRRLKVEYNAKEAMLWSRLSSRKVLNDVFCKLAKDHDFMVMVADVTSSTNLGGFKELYPDRFINVGIAETNMVAMATGIAETGKNVFVMTFAPFASMRCFEAVRTYVGYMHANVKIIGLMSGLSMGVGGNTHFGLEDISLMRTVPGMTVVSPADCTETAKTIEKSMDFKGPMYIRLTGVYGNPIVYKDDYDFAIGKFNVLREGSHILILASGMCVNESNRAAKLLAKEGINPTVVDVHTIKPLDTELLHKLLKNHNNVITVEEHTLIGGLGSAISEFITNNSYKNNLKCIGLPDKFGPAANYGYLQEYYGLNAKSIANIVQNFVKENE